MKALLAILLLTTSLVHATGVGIAMIKQPLYLAGAEIDQQIAIADVPVVINFSGSSSHVGAIVVPFVPTFTTKWKTPHDVNLASLYGITLEALEEKSGLVVTIDASKAKVPEGYPFSIDQVTDAVSTCVKLMSPEQPPRKLTLKTILPAAMKEEKPDGKGAPGK